MVTGALICLVHDSMVHQSFTAISPQAPEITRCPPMEKLLRSGKMSLCPMSKPSLCQNHIPHQSPNQKAKLKNGKRCCPGCAKCIQLADFPKGSRFCIECKQAVQNAKKASIADGCEEFFQEVFNDPERLRAMLAEIKERCPPVERGKKRKSVPMAQLVEAHRMMQSVMRDKVYGFMHKKQLAHRMTQP